ncbi:hypothetical protein COCSUDRAFT_56498 [Coccomyxa subellipsoidea C-169]|uniref:Uncharacterized protein n=1 Tax=Coccomyxa subellipsoidea (strain C-169) TaxID=574566 RepID=I0YUJ7_COCSC|nr:hypothetical protein COCSUDRAFT_56498 [Coccomyxa subellipsoidea C-169]EIE22066.1 hypothetical protein COCSUDRAFT_56498 [Coccomyxa subellipsoidea C-169]|eukprot:XP_005646610.1 hypothetical protein COCSUDRAFT_56498 [Coccomyxa subellipsoidea C-169]
MAAGVASYILVSFQSGRQKAVPAALYCSLGAGGLHWLSQRYNWGALTRRTLVRMDLLDDEEVKRELEQPKLPYSTVRKEDLGWRRHLPIRKLTEEEWEQYQAVRKQRFKDRHSGGIAGILEEQQQGRSLDDTQQR